MFTLTDEQLQERGFIQYSPGRWGKRTLSTTLYYYKIEYFQIPMPRWSFGDWMHSLFIENETDLDHIERIFGKNTLNDKSNKLDGKDK